MMTQERDPQADSLIFTPVTLADYDRVYPYTSAYGEGSCQHSPVSMLSLSEKYGDAVCIRDGFLYTLRSHLCGGGYRVCLAPLGGGSLAQAFGRLLDDSRACGQKVKFISLTEKAAGVLGDSFPGRFDITENRDLAEYLYLTKRMAFFPGGALKKRRNEVNAFWAHYGDRAAVKRITPADADDLLAFEQQWLEVSSETHDRTALEREARMIGMQMRLFDALHLSGVVLRIDGQVRGFSYGVRLSDTCYDAIAEKGDRTVPHLYKVLRQESVKQCALDCVYVNVEEDLGIPGLRALKCAYQPDLMIRKFIAIER